ncbi:hypothetical protein B7P43_G09874 [Cryptotermes secundus]|uniref:Uncharacterized protein n=1 Tax=Cryptotermes secundus TaxID=105785 RepID=A0A2J7PZI4_9NEOP|nr:uncharacterized protein LOC111870823 [Cryptotermes secundus]PNF21747.1 hypothetical protein B7P43_G09874 [Cryptotermes secundus]
MMVFKMAAVDVVLNFASRIFDQDFGDSGEIDCAKCQILKDYLKLAATELKSAQQVIKILYEERAELNNLKNHVNPTNVTNRIPVNVRCWKKKSVKVNHISEISDKVKHKIRIVGDSHAGGLANELKGKLTLDFETQGLVKPGSPVGELVHLTDSDLKDLTMNDVCVVWGGSNDVGRNEPNLGMRALKQIISSLNHTNAIVINVPPRYDLASNSCVNDEVQKFNRKLVNLEKAYLNLSIVTVDSNRDLFTRHGLHLNSQGKAYTAKRLATVINGLFTISKSVPIVLKWRCLGDAQHWVQDLEAHGQEDKADKINMEIKKPQQEDKGGGKEEDRESENLSEGEQTMRTCEGVVGGEGGL